MTYKIKEFIPDRNKKVTSPEDIAKILRAILMQDDEFDRVKEHFYCVHFNTRQSIICIDLVSLGTLTASLVHPREVFRRAIVKNAVSVIVCHNHPSGETDPSEEDIKITKRLREAGQLVGIEFLDHVIITHESEDFTSFKEKGLI